MRISDWSSDVCSSDLQRVAVDAEAGERGVDDGVALAEAVADAHQVDEQVVGGHLGEIEVPEHGVHPVDPLVVPDATRLAEGRSEERRVGKECVSTCRSRWSPYH